MILASEPSFVFTISPEATFEFYAGWLKSSVKLVSLPLACDTKLYKKNSPTLSRFEQTEMAFVGGYWPYKARQFDRYLKPYEKALQVFGYSPWPYANYGGQLAEEDEAPLYNQALVSPIINEPHVEVMGTDINERVFKVLGSGGLAVTDIIPACREWFSSDELLVPGNVNEYHEIVQLALTGNDFNQRYRRSGYEAILERHTYAHRARTILRYLGIDPPQALL